MIIVLNNKEKKIASDILNVQLPAYRVEADIIGFDDIPPLRDTTQSIIDSNELFVGYLSEETLNGFISYHNNDDVIDICRLVVHPSQFRKGIAKRLLTYVITGSAAGKKVVVSTGAKNLPAIELYTSFGFKKIKDIEVAPDVYITQFEASHYV